MTQLVQGAKSLLSDIQTKRKVEQDPERLRRMDIWASEIGKMIRQLDGEEEHRHCNKCLQEKPVIEFGVVRTTRTLKGGLRRTYVKRRNVCSACLWPESKRRK